MDFGKQHKLFGPDIEANKAVVLIEIDNEHIRPKIT